MNKSWLLGAAAVAVVLVLAIALLQNGSGPSESPPDRMPDGAVDAETVAAPDQLAGAGYLVHAADASAGAVLRLLLRGRGAPDRLCVIGEPDAAVPLDRARCRDVPGAGASSFVLTSDRVVAGLLRSDGTLLDAEGRHLAAGVSQAYVSDGPLIATGEEDREFRRGEASRPLAGDDVVLVGDQVVVRERTDEADRILLVNFDEEAPRVLGELPIHTERMRVCSRDDVGVLAVDTRLSSGQRKVHVFFHQEGSWSEDVVTDARGPEYRLSCRPGRAAITWLDADGSQAVRVRTVHRGVCTPEGCTHTQSVAQIAGSDPMVGELGDQILMVWASEDGTRGRLAPLTEIDEGRTLGLLHDSDLRVLARRLYFRQGAAILTLRTAEGVSAIRIGQDGRHALLPVGALE
ncbi:MAG: hypothetical protein AAGF12_29040 [Myxococcota bacterium]